MLPGSPIFFRGGGRCAVTAIRPDSDSAGHSNVSVATAIALDAHRLDAAGWFSAAAVAAVFAVAHNDATPRRRSSREVRLPVSGAMRSATWAEQKPCVLCASASS